jgi:hypothetical protein
MQSEATMWQVSERGICALRLKLGSAWEEAMAKNALAALLTMALMALSAMYAWNTVRVVALVFQLQSDYYFNQIYLEQIRGNQETF